MSNCYSSYQTLVTFETGIKECITDYNSLEIMWKQLLIQIMLILHTIALLVILIICLIIVNFIKDKFVKIYMKKSQKEKISI